MRKVWLRNLQKIRESKNITQVGLAMKAEISQQSITYYETGTRCASMEVAVKLANILNTSIDYLIGRDEILHKYYQLKQEDKDTINRMIDSLSKK